MERARRTRGADSATGILGVIDPTSPALILILMFGTFLAYGGWGAFQKAETLGISSAATPATATATATEDLSQRLA